MRPRRLLPAAFLVILPLTGCASGLHDATSHEHGTPWVANANAGDIKVRNVVVSPSIGGGTAQAYLSMALAISGTRTDELTGATVGTSGTVTPTAPGATFTVTPNQLLIIPNPESGTGTTAPGLAVTGLTTVPQVGTTVRVTLTFRDAGSVIIQAPVRPAVVA